MSTSSGFDFLRFRDGTSQQQRISKALDPDFFALDERSLWDLLKFAQRYAGTLIYFNQNNEAAGDWSGFLEGDKDTLNEMVAYLKNPSYFDHQPEKKERYSRPHFALFLTFLSLLQEAQVQMNQITQRQLDFYYRQALGLRRRPGRPDRVHLLAELEPEEDQVLIPKGTQLFAGEDEEGDPILYQTDETLLANRARISQIKSLHVDKDVQNLFSIREFERDTAKPEEVFVQQLELVYRQPGTDNTPWPYPGHEPKDRVLDKALVENLDALASFIKDKLFLPRVTSFQYLIELYRAWENPLNWHREGKEVLGEKGGGINDYLSRVNPTFDPISIDDPRNFDANFQAALGVQVNGTADADNLNKFINLDGVENIYDLYFAYLLLKNTDEQQNLQHPVPIVILEDLGFEFLEDFEAMMKLRMDTLGYLKDVIRILRENIPASLATHPDIDAGLLANLDTLNNQDNLHLFYAKDATLSLLIQYICKLPQSALAFSSWDKELLTIGIRSDSTLKEVSDHWEEQPQKGGFYIEPVGTGGLTASSGVTPLEEERSAQIPTDQPGSFLKALYKGASEQPKVKIVTDNRNANSVEFDTVSKPGMLNIQLKPGRMLLEELLTAWREGDTILNASKGGFDLQLITPGLAASMSEQALNHEFSIRLPADKLQNFLQINYSGPSESPELAILLDESQAELVRFELPAMEKLPNDEQPDVFEKLILTVRNEKTASEEILAAWKKVNQKRGFSMEFIGTGSTGIGTTDPEQPLGLNRVFSTKLPAGQADNYLEIRYAGPAPESGSPKVEVKPVSVTPPASHLVVKADISSGILTIELGEDTEIKDILKVWESLTPEERAGFGLKAIGPAAGSTGITKTASSTELAKAFSIELETTQPGVFLKAKYPGILSGAALAAPKIKVGPVSTQASEITFPLSESLLTISLKKDNTPVHRILETWKDLTIQNKGGFELEFTKPKLSEAEAELKRFFTTQIEGDDTGNFLTITYRGLHRSPKVSVVDVRTAPMNISASHEVFDDEYFKIKGAQLAQIERYFRMQAEDFFFIRDLFRVELGEDWAYRDPTWKWRRTDELFEKAHRDLLGRLAIPEISRWKNLYIAQDATQVLVPGFAEKEEFPRWKTFGKAPDPAIPEEMELIETGELGFIFTSPALRLQEGRRTLTLALNFDKRGFNHKNLIEFFGKLPKADDPPSRFNPPFTIEVSTEEAWVVVDDWQQFVISAEEEPPSITIELLLNEEFAPLLPVVEDPLSGPWPALKFSLNRNKIDLFDPTTKTLKESRRPYELMRELLISGIHMEVDVEGLTTLQVQNLQGSIDPQKPFEPFGTNPQANDRLFITHPELAAQRLDSVTLKPVWNILPAAFQMEMALHDAHRYFQMKADLAGLTHDLIPGTKEIISAKIPANQVFSPNDVPYARKPNAAPEISGDVLEAERYLELKLLGPRQLSNLLTLQAIDGKLFETRPVEEIEVNATPVKIIQLQRDVARGLPIESFTVKYKITAAAAAAVVSAATNVKTAADTAVNEAEDAVIETFENAFESRPSTIEEALREAEKKLEDAEREAKAALKAAEDFANDNKTDLEGADAAKKTAAQAALATHTDKVTRTGAKVSENARVAGEIRQAVAAATMAAEAAATATKALAEVTKAVAEMPGDLQAEPVAAGELIVTYHDEAEKQLKVPDGLTAGLELVISYPAPFLLEDAFTPVIDSLRIDYSTSTAVVLPVEERTRFAEDPLPEPGAQPVQTEGRLFHLHPFGRSDLESSGAWIKIAEDKGNETITEKKVFQFLPRYDDEGELYLGIEHLQPPQSLSLLFQLAEGSGNPDLPAGKLEWACLAGDDWQDIKGEQIGMDTTNGLLNSGIVQLHIPATASRQHTRMPEGYHWIRIRVNRHSESLNDAIAIFPQALQATWLDQGLQSSDIERVLPPKSIADPNEPIPGLLTFLQPYSSFEGKAREQAPAFHLRVSERLRHKGRGLTMWDYERLVLEQFPDIYKAKALAADLLDPGTLPGTVAVIVVPDVRFRRPFNPFEPKAPQRQIQEIQAFLQKLAPPFVRVQVQNPRFDYLHVRGAVKFYDMNNFNFYADQLKRELKQFLSPWAFEEGGEITFGREIYLSMLVHFMETRPYVDFIDQARLILKERLASDGSLRPVKGVGAATRLRGPDVILVSTPDHTIEFLDDSIDPQKRILSGIGYAKLDLDFKVAEDKPQPES
ncbi:MAG: hypothetical protein H6573_23860 [Lewinellaceae bacterium]|nr:hypothetical protein [Lewinellaceae bacterium]